MSKSVMALLVVTSLIITGCSGSSNKEEKENIEEPKGQNEVDDSDQNPNEKVGLSLQVLKIDQENGVTIENDDIYNGLDGMIAQAPTMGADDDFTVRTMNIYNAEDGSMLILLGINRLDVPIKDISFDLTLGSNSGEYVWKDFPINMSENHAGILQPDSAVPILLNLSEDEEALLRTIDQDNIQIVIKDFDAEIIE